MGVDIQTYRVRIGSYGGSGSSPNLEMTKLTLNITSFLKCIGAVVFIGLLLLMAGIESNPGPGPIDNGNDQSTQTDSRDYPGSETAGEVSGSCVTSEIQSPWKMFFRKYDMKKQYPDKITIKEASTIVLNEVGKNEDIPWVLLRNLMLSKCDARDSIVSVYSVEDDSDDIDLLTDDHTPKENDDVCSLDILLAIVQCSHPILKQVLYKKMYLCKIAVPFLYQNYNISKNILSLWPLRSLMIENTDEAILSKKTEIEAIHLRSNFILMTRIGRPSFSKSKLLNTLFVNKAFSTFFNKDCPSGNSEKVICKGYVEAFWLPLSVAKEKGFSGALTFLNARGNLEHDFHEEDIILLSQLVDVVTVVIDSDSLPKNTQYLLNLLKQFKKVILILCNPFSLTYDVSETLKKLPPKEFNLITTYKNKKEKRNGFEIAEKFTKSLQKHIKDMELLSLHYRIKRLSVMTDESKENNLDLFESKLQAEQYFDLIKQVKTKQWKEMLSPVQFKLSESLAKYLKDKSRQEHTEHIKAQISKIQQKQMNSIKKYTQMFAKMLVEAGSVSIRRLELVLSWLGIFIDGEVSEILPEFLERNQLEWEKLSETRKKNPNSQSEMQQRNKFKESTRTLENMSFGLVHLLREIYHLYDTFIIAKTNPEKKGMPSVANMTEIFSDLIFEGFSFEIMNGEDIFVPTKWINEVFGKVNRKLEDKRVFVISVLGLQSSGKSTLLNTMFGSQFSVSAGRCTRGINAQLFQVEACTQAFQYVLVVDTEGLRSPQLGLKTNIHDNEMATFATGFGDLTLLNIMGENTSEINDILQIMVHAFLRIKLANKDIKLTQSCVFLHQNVTDAAADQKMKPGFRKLMNTLDEMTSEAATSENIGDISSFNQVIKFDDESCVWLFKNVWQGAPPSARVSSNYSSKALKLKQCVIHKALNEKGVAYKTFKDISVKIQDLYEGILSENFVFSFKNSLEIKAHLALEKGITAIKMTLEKERAEAIRVSSDKKFSDCNSEDQLDSAKRDIQKDLIEQMDTFKTIALQQLNLLFQNSDYPEIIENWKASKERDMEIFIHVMEDNIYDEISRLKQNREIVVKASMFYNKKESDIFETSKNLARKIRNGQIQTHEVEDEFDKMWKEFTKDFPEHRSGMPLVAHFKSSIWDFLKKDSNIFAGKVVTWLESKEPSIKKLEGSFPLTSIGKEDLSKCHFYQKVGLFEESLLSTASKEIDTLFRKLDYDISTLDKTETEIQDFHVREFIQTIIKWSLTMEQQKQNLKILFKTTCIVKLVFHSCRFALETFKRHNEEYQRKHGIEAQLSKLKTIARNKLQVLIEDLNDEETVSSMLGVVLGKYIEQDLRKKLPTAVQETLSVIIPPTKYSLIIEIMQSLMTGYEFEEFMEYIRFPDTFGKRLITNKCMDALFDPPSCKYREIAHRMVDKIFLDFRTALDESAVELLEKRPMQLDRWIERYKACLEQRNIFLPNEMFSQSLPKKGEKRFTENFLSLIQGEFDNCKQKMKDYLDKESPSSIKWEGFDPINKLFDQIWGCKETCVYCKEPCYKGAQHVSPERHSCVQHRPPLCIGIREKDSQKCSIYTCNYFVASNHTHTCECFGEICKRVSGKCNISMHPYKEYSKYAKNWFIEPNKDMERRSEFWMRFAVKHKEKLKLRFGYDISNIPKSWHNITDQDAIDSLLQYHKL